MKRQEFIREIVRAGCHLLRHGKKHDIYRNWNCTHIANATLRSRIEKICRDAGYEPPVICTPEELLKE